MIRIYAFEPGRTAAEIGRALEAAGARRVTVQAVETLDPGLAIDVSDDGPGLASAAQKGLFTPFAGSARQGGTGLGLVHGASDGNRPAT